ncbi:MAG: hypothetical protein ACRDE8_18000, partial [Ginsengibacter sp.]
MNRKYYIKESNYNYKDDLIKSVSQEKLLKFLETSTKHFKTAYVDGIFDKLYSTTQPVDYRNFIPLGPCKIDLDFTYDTWEKLPPRICNLGFIENILSKHLIVSDNLFKASGYVYSGRNKRNISELNEKIRALKARFKNKFSSNLGLEIKALVDELHSYLLLNLKCFKKGTKRFRQLFSSPVKRDIRKIYRSIVTFVFKNLSDQSGCEEDLFTGINTGKYFFLSI